MRLYQFAVAAALAAFFVAHAQAQNAGSVTNHAFMIGKGAGTTGYTSLLCTSAQLAVGQAAADPICRTVTGDVTITAAGVTAIGASKVTNSQLATMAANTTKCNATAGSANPTDCTASTMRTNIGVVIGTNVQAWDTDLDCIAGLSSTGMVKRTGAGTCSAGAMALSDLATGTQDTVVGYFGSTTASGLAIPNCTGALTYSTTTHTIGCNATSAGNVSNTGTPTANQIAQWTNATTIQGVAYGTLMGTSSYVAGGPASPTGTASTTGVMMGIGGTCKITPATSGRVRFTIEGNVSNNNAAVSSFLSGRYGTGTAPTNGAASTAGTAFVPNTIQLSSPASNYQLHFIIEGIVASLSGVQYWFDAVLSTNNAGTTSSISNLTCIAQEF